MQLVIAAFAMGLLGSFHCVGMCGPIALSLPLNKQTNWAKFSGAFIYNSGRVVTYSMFGLVFGIIGKSIAFFGFQQWLSIAMGVTIIIVVLLPKKISFIKNANFFVSFFSRLRAAIAALFRKQNNFSLFSIGLLNGLLPCGLIYIAAASAIAKGDILSSIIFMASFGVGTLPMMWSVAYFGNYVSVNMRQKIRKFYPIIMILLACLLILRGMGLGIKYISPKLSPENKNIIICSIEKNNP